LAVGAYISQWPSSPDDTKVKFDVFARNQIGHLIGFVVRFYFKLYQFFPKTNLFFLHRACALIKISNLLVGPEWEQEILFQESFNPREKRSGEKKDQRSDEATRNADEPNV
jgi:hypothetical protein